MRVLLHNGSDPASAIHLAIQKEDIQGIETLLASGCPFYVSSPRSCLKDKFNRNYNLLSFALDQRSPFPVLVLLIDKLAQQRYQLRQLASQHLSTYVCQTLQVEKYQRLNLLPDEHASEIAKTLQKRGIRLPVSCWPDRCTTLYHDANMTRSIARRLYETGFRDLDVQDQQGITPLIEALLNSNCQGQLINWYIEQGADYDLRRTGLTNCLHLYSHARGVALASPRWSATSWSRGSAIEIFQYLSEICGVMVPDKCSCWCSSRGCIPAGIVLRSKGGFRDRRRRSRWLFHLPRYSSLGLHLNEFCFAEICRLEIFDRLGMAHTCCSMAVCREGHGRGIKLRYTPTPADLRSELQDEDSEFKAILDAYVELHQQLLEEHGSRFERFWIAWWITLDTYLPHEPDRKHCSALDNVAQYHFGAAKDGLETTDDYGPDCEAIRAAIISKFGALHQDGLHVLDLFEPDAQERYLIDVFSSRRIK